MSLFKIHRLLTEADQECVAQIIAALHPDFSEPNVEVAQEFIKLRDEIQNGLNFISNSEVWNTDATEHSH